MNDTALPGPCTMSYGAVVAPVETPVSKLLPPSPDVNSSTCANGPLVKP
jgi:hypothetical protein